MKSVIDLISLTYLIYQSYQDVKRKSVTLASVIVFVMLVLVIDVLWNKPIDRIVMGMIPGLFVIFISRVSKEAIGYGDGGILLGIGILKGIDKITETLFIALILVFLYFLILFLTGRIKAKQQIPFIPFLLVAYIIILFV